MLIFAMGSHLQLSNHCAVSSVIQLQDYAVLRGCITETIVWDNCSILDLLLKWTSYVFYTNLLREFVSGFMTGFNLSSKRTVRNNLINPNKSQVTNYNLIVFQSPDCFSLLLLCTNHQDSRKHGACII